MRECILCQLFSVHNWNFVSVKRSASNGGVEEEEGEVSESLRGYLRPGRGEGLRVYLGPAICDYHYRSHEIHREDSK